MHVRSLRGRRQLHSTLRQERGEQAAVFRSDVCPGHLTTETVGAALGARAQRGLVEQRGDHLRDR